MPFLRLTLDREPTVEDRRRLAEALTELTAAVLGKNYSLTALTIDVVPSTRWTIAAETLAESRMANAHLDVKVTAGTNTAAVSSVSASARRRRSSTVGSRSRVRRRNGMAWSLSMPGVR